MTETAEALPLAARIPMVGWKMPVTSSLLGRLSRCERALLLGMWHATNELNVLKKLILLTNNLIVAGQMEEAGRSQNSWTLTKVFATKAFEAWDFFKSAQNFPEFREAYLTDPDAADLIGAKDWLGKYFGRRSLLEDVRNKAGAHYDYRFVLAAVDQIGELDSFVLFTEHQGNSLYWAAEEVMAGGIRTAIAPSKELGEIVDQIVGEAIEVGVKLDDLAQGIGIVAMKRASDSSEPFARVEFSGRRGELSDIPYFVDFSQSLLD